jgi:hypothetical protein
MLENQTKKIPSKYDRIISGKCGNKAVIDVYDVLKAFEVSNPAIQHAVKKLLAGGKRGYKDVIKDYTEAITSVERGIDLENTGIGEQI